MDNAKVLILCWLRSMILKIDAATFYVHMTKHSQISRKISFKIDYNCHHNIFTVRCNYVVLVVLAQVVIIIVYTISYLYISLFIYLSILFNLLFLALTLLSHIDWYELEIILWIVCTFFLFVFFFTILSTWSKVFQFQFQQKLKVPQHQQCLLRNTHVEQMIIYKCLFVN